MKREDRRKAFVGALIAVLLASFLVLLVDSSVLMPNSVVGVWGGAWGSGLGGGNDDPPQFIPTEWNFSAEGIVYITLEVPIEEEAEGFVIEVRYTFDGSTVRIADAMLPPGGSGLTAFLAELQVTGDDMSGELLYSERGENGRAMRVTLQRR